MFVRQVGAQNAGKSSLINAMRRAVGKGDIKAELTTAALPGTTLGARDRLDAFPFVYDLVDSYVMAYSAGIDLLPTFVGWGARMSCRLAQSSTSSS